MSPAGLLVMDKPSGITSHGVVANVRRALNTRKVGHAGTLDPMATGVLLIGVGKATRLLGHLALHDKAYEATIRLGVTTVTDDREGEIIAVADSGVLAAVSDEAIAQAVAELTGELMQVPTAVSAIKVDGKRAYDLVRSGAEVELPARAVHVEEFTIRALRRLPDAIDLDVDVSCSTGTYVRALARDLGSTLGVGGHLTALRRTRVGGWTVSEGVRLDAFMTEENPGRRLIAIDDVARRSFPTYVVDERQAEDIRHGRRIPWPGEHGVIALFDERDRVLALAERRGDEATYLAVLAD